MTKIYAKFQFMMRPRPFYQLLKSKKNTLEANGSEKAIKTFKDTITPDQDEVSFDLLLGTNASLYGKYVMLSYK